MPASAACACGAASAELVRGPWLVVGCAFVVEAVDAIMELMITHRDEELQGQACCWY